MELSSSSLTQEEVDTVVNLSEPDLQSTQPCYFPALTDGPTAKDAPLVGTVHIPTQGIPDLSYFCQCHGVAPSAVLNTVWALLLRCFTGESDVCFGYLPASSQRDGTIPIHVRFVDARSIKKIILEVEDGDGQTHPYREHMQPSLANSPRADPVHPYNTVVTQHSSASARIPTAKEDSVRCPSSIVIFATELK